MIVLEQENRILKDYVERAIRSCRDVVDANLEEFGVLVYNVLCTSAEPDKLKISLSFKNGVPGGAIDHAAAQAMLAESCGGVAAVDAQPVAPFELTVSIDVAQLRAKGEEEQAALVSKLASLRALLLALPLRRLLLPLQAGTTSVGPVVAIGHRPEEVYFVKPENGSVIIVYPMCFRDANDSVIAATFLQEFAEARRGQPQGNAPPCTYSWAAPMELQGVPADKLPKATAGFISFVLFPRHVQGKLLETSLWSFSTFHTYISYHIKCSKAHLHSRMRLRVSSLLQVLNRAKPDVTKEKKTASGRTFVRAV
eukprot:jgi/Mesvir1/17274/Mv07682-RA.1